ncbi:peptidase M13 [Vulcanimicrobium alpinum]|uniref:Peptidase M13 n=1 Tax=Vulcanimicrobium alpinum TaxID=3016050 RepID=A0AAN1XWY1_UNVUL|nr:alpha/beta fold hydrolase [Vulcanimicrobium alpinum]BDE06901.1 peptidase M13 [Vulcanimicrobium alpinum]
MKPNIVLCHGAFADETAWKRVAPLLQQAGAKVAVVTLPGHSDADTARAGAVTLADYVAAVNAKLDEAGPPALLVGHSMGGVAITQTAEQYPDKIRALVYLSAYLPANGKALQDYANDPESKLGPGLKIDAQHGVGTISADTMRAAFFNNTSAADAEAGLARLRPEPLQPFGTPVHTTAQKWGRVPRFYITTLRDQAVGPALQKSMYTAQPVQKVYTLDTDHSSYFSSTDQLAKIILEVRDSLA